MLQKEIDTDVPVHTHIDYTCCPKLAIEFGRSRESGIILFSKQRCPCHVRKAVHIRAWIISYRTMKWANLLKPYSTFGSTLPPWLLPSKGEHSGAGWPHGKPGFHSMRQFYMWLRTGVRYTVVDNFFFLHQGRLKKEEIVTSIEVACILAHAMVQCGI